MNQCTSRPTLVVFQPIVNIAGSSAASIFRVRQDVLDLPRGVPLVPTGGRQALVWWMQMRSWLPSRMRLNRSGPAEVHLSIYHVLPQVIPPRCVVDVCLSDTISERQQAFGCGHRHGNHDGTHPSNHHGHRPTQAHPIPSMQPHCKCSISHPEWLDPEKRSI